MSEIERLDGLVTWMRKRGVGALTSGDATISLSTLQEPADIEEAAKRAAEEDSKLSAAERAEQDRERRARLLYGPQIRRKDVNK